MNTDSKKSRIAAWLTVAVIALAWAGNARAGAPAGRYTLDTDTVVDTTNGLTWQRVAPTNMYTLADAKAYCAALSLGSIGVGGWRLPRKLELETILDIDVYGPAIDVVAFPSTPSSYFWTSSALIGSATTYYIVGFTEGYVNNGESSATYAVRCVH